MCLIVSWLGFTTQWLLCGLTPLSWIQMFVVEVFSCLPLWDGCVLRSVMCVVFM